MGTPALFNCGEALFWRQFLLKDVGWVLDFAAAGAGQVAAEERLKHEHERILLLALELLLHVRTLQRSTSERWVQPSVKTS